MAKVYEPALLGGSFRSPAGMVSGPSPTCTWPSSEPAASARSRLSIPPEWASVRWSFWDPDVIKTVNTFNRSGSFTFADAHSRAGKAQTLAAMIIRVALVREIRVRGGGWMSGIRTSWLGLDADRDQHGGRRRACPPFCKRRGLRPFRTSAGRRQRYSLDRRGRRDGRRRDG